MSQDRLWFEHAVDGLFNHALRRQQTPELLEKLRAVGIDLERKLAPAYSAETWNKAVKIAAHEVFGDQGRNEGVYRLGEIFTDGYQNTGLGRALFVLLRAMGARRTLPRLGRSLRHVNNYVEVDVQEPIGGCYSVTFSEVDDLPYFFKGLFDASGRLLGAPRNSDDHFEIAGRRLTLYVDLNDTPHPRFSELWKGRASSAA